MRACVREHVCLLTESVFDFIILVALFFCCFLFGTDYLAFQRQLGTMRTIGRWVAMAARVCAMLRHRNPLFSIRRNWDFVVFVRVHRAMMSQRVRVLVSYKADIPTSSPPVPIGSYRNSNYNHRQKIACARRASRSAASINNMLGQ